MTVTTSNRAVTPGPAQQQPGQGGPGRLRRVFDRHWYAWAMVAPVVIVLAILVLYPLIQGIALSLTDATAQTLANPRLNRPALYSFVGLDNYIDILTGEVGAFWPVLLRTLVWTGGCVVLTFAIGLGLAVMLNRPMRGRTAYRLLLILPWAVPAFVSAFGWRFMFNAQSGLLNQLLTAVGLGTVDWLGQSNMVLVSVMMVNIWLGVPFMMVALLGGLQSIPAEIYEAAEVDGASPWQRFVNVTLPGLRSVSSTVVLLGVIWTFNMFPIIYLIAPSNQYAQILVTYSFNLFNNNLVAQASTYGVLILSLLLVFASVYRRFLSRQGEGW